MHETRNTITLIKPAAMYRMLCERFRDGTIAKVEKFLYVQGVDITGQTLRNWFEYKTSSPPLEKWARIEPILKKMLGRS